MTREEYHRTVKSGGMYTTRDVYGNPRFIIHFLDLVHEDHPGDHCDKMDFGREALEFGRDHFTIDTGNYVITVDPKRYRIFDRAAGKSLVDGVVRIDEQDVKDILAAAPKSQRGWIRTRLGYMVVV